MPDDSVIVQFAPAGIGQPLQPTNCQCPAGADCGMAVSVTMVCTPGKLIVFTIVGGQPVIVPLGADEGDTHVVPPTIEPEPAMIGCAMICPADAGAAVTSRP